MTTAISEGEGLRRASLRYLWMHNRDWTQMAEEGEPQIIESGEGVRVTDAEGRSWIDVNGGYNSVNAGYGRAEIGEAAYEQMVNLHYFPQGTTTVPMAQLAAKLAEIAPGSLSRVFPVSGGSEANETALKIARAYHKRVGEPGRYKVISRIGSYHGMTAGVLWLGGSPYQPRHDYEPIYPGMVHAPQPNPYRSSLDGETASENAVRCAEAVERLIQFHGPQTVAAVIAEPVAIPQGAVVPGDEYWPMMRQICDKYGVLLIADEVICGFGRTGKMFALEHWDVVPDIMTVAKGIISSYLPMAATVVRQEVADAFAGEKNLLRHVFTAAGHPVSACRVAEEHRDNRERRPGGELGAGGRVLQAATRRACGGPSASGRCARHRSAARGGAGKRPQDEGGLPGGRASAGAPERKVQAARADIPHQQQHPEHRAAAVHHARGS